MANGSLNVGIWVAHCSVKMIIIDLAYLIKPTSALGTIVANVNKISGGVTTLVQQTSNFDEKV